MKGVLISSIVRGYTAIGRSCKASANRGKGSAKTSSRGFAPAAVFILAVILFLPLHAFAQCSEILIDRSARGVTLLQLAGGLMEAKVVNVPGEKSIKILGHEAFETTKFRGFYVTPGQVYKLFVKASSINTPSHKAPKLVLAGTLGENEQVLWVLAFRGANNEKTAILYETGGEISCSLLDDFPPEEVVSWLPGIPANEARLEMVDPNVVYSQLGL